MPPQANIVSFDAARRAASGGRAPASRHAASGAAGRRPAGRVLIGGDQSAIVRDGDEGRGRPFTVPRPTPSWYDGGASAAVRPDDGFLSGAAARADEEAGEEYEARLLAALEERERGPLDRLRAKRRERTKDRADRAYFRQYEAGAPADGAQGGPRAAVYKGEMGSSHRRSSRMQQQASAGARSHGGRVRGTSDAPSPFRHPSLMGLAATALCIAFGVAFLYGPAQQLYVDLREKDRLTAEYEAVVERNEALGAQVDALQTEAGIEDAARTQLGWVREGEHAVSVAGLAERAKPEFRGNIVSEDVELPETWYSGVLDPLFGVS